MYSKWQWDTGDDEPPKKQMVCSWPCLPYICADQIFNQCIWWHLIRSGCRRLKNWICDSIETTLSDGCFVFGDVLRNVSAKMMLYLKKTTLMCNKHIFNWRAVEIWNLPAEWYKSPKYHFCCSHYFVTSQPASGFWFNVVSFIWLFVFSADFHRRKVLKEWSDDAVANYLAWAVFITW